jgi:arylsulfatase A-like enzyme
VTDKTVSEVWPRFTYPAKGKPSVVFIVLDDVGFAHLGCFGSEISTPHMDDLAAGGLRFNNFHTTALCSPTRASLLTGRNHHSVGMGMIAGLANGHPGHVGEISRSAGLFSEIVREDGYSTIALGKWHLTPLENVSVAGPCDQWPLARGFEQFYGFLGPETDQFFPELVVGNDFVDPPAREDYHLSEDLTDQAIARITNLRATDPERPYFMYLALGAAHAPLQAPRSYIERYAGKFDEGWDVVRQRTYQRQLQMGVIPEGTRLAPRNDGVPAWTDVSENERKVFAREQEVFAGFLEHTDAQIGRLVQFLRQIDDFENTIIVLISDNGASQEGGPVGGSELLWVTGIPVTAEDLLPHLPDFGGPDHHCHYPLGWAQVGNTPLKRYKRDTYGGGVRDPLLISWPRGITDGGAIRSQYVHVVDVVPTVLEALDLRLPAEIAGVEQMPLEGQSFLGALSDPSFPDVKEKQYFEMAGNRAIWYRGWKAVTSHTPGTPFDEDEWALFDTTSDFSECDDLSAEFPDKLRELTEIWADEAEKYQVQLDDQFLKRRLQGLYRRRLHYPKKLRLYRDATIQQFLAPAAPGIPKRITASIERSSTSDDGVLAAFGGRFGGYTLFVMDDRLHFEHSFYLQPVKSVTSEQPLGTGPRECGFEVSAAGDQVCVQLTVDGSAAAPPLEMVMHPLTPYGMGPFQIGRDSVTPVSRRYRSPFPFAGQLAHVEVEVPDDWPEAHIRDFTVGSVLLQD